MDRLEERTILEDDARLPEELSDRDKADREERLAVDEESTRPTDPRPKEPTDHGQSYLPEQASAEANESWLRIQAAFVDDPRKSVAEAHKLVGELMEKIAEAFARDRDELERQWSAGGTASTEDLRLCLQRYRTFFGRLLRDV